MLKEVVDFGKKFVIDKSEAKIDTFNVGDTITVGLKIVDGNVVRVQNFTGTCIAIRKKGVGTNFIVRKIVGETSVERNVMMYSPLVAYIKLVRSGKVRRAKLYYMCNLHGKAARIEERAKPVATKASKNKVKDDTSGEKQVEVKLKNDKDEDKLKTEEKNSKGKSEDNKDSKNKSSKE